MEYYSSEDDAIIVFRVTEVKTSKVKLKDTDFLIPSDFDELTEEEAKELLGQ